MFEVFRQKDIYRKKWKLFMNIYNEVKYLIQTKIIEMRKISIFIKQKKK